MLLSFIGITNKIKMLRFDPSLEFASAYTRSNKAVKQKNVRCFPTHRENGHCQTRYCGRMITVYAEGYTKPIKLAAAFRFLHLETFPIGHTLTSTALAGLDDGTKTCEFVFGKRGESDAFVFGTDERWHYGFSSSGHSLRKRRHVWSVYAFEFQGGEEWRLVSRLDSPSFTMHSIRRVRGAVIQEIMTTVTLQKVDSPPLRKKLNIVIERPTTLCEFLSKIKYGELMLSFERFKPKFEEIIKEWPSIIPSDGGGTFYSYLVKSRPFRTFMLELIDVDESVKTKFYWLVKSEKLAFLKLQEQMRRDYVLLSNVKSPMLSPYFQ
jgi:hypothetical protein